MQRGIQRCLIAVAIVLFAWACGRSSDGARSSTDAQRATDTLTRRQKDSLISTMPVPGAGAVGRALDAQDASRARAQALDSILNGR
jgi:hypothetical protein